MPPAITCYGQETCDAPASHPFMLITRRHTCPIYSLGLACHVEIGQGHPRLGSIEEGEEVGVISLCCEDGCGSITKKPLIF
jgi:hypothetical protein